MRGSMEAVMVACDVALLSPAVALDMMRYVNPESSFSRRLRSCYIDLFVFLLFSRRVVFPLRSRHYFSFLFAASPWLTLLAVISFFVAFFFLGSSRYSADSAAAAFLSWPSSTQAREGRDSSSGRAFRELDVD
jgi:hypothetical protein